MSNLDGEDDIQHGNPQDEEQRPLEELVFSRENATPSRQNGASRSTNESSAFNSGDSMLTDNDLSTSLLQGEGASSGANDGNDGPSSSGADLCTMTPTQFLEAASRPHSSVRLVLRKIGNFVATFTLLAMLVIIPIVTYKQLERKKVDFAAFDSAGVMVFGTLILSVRLVYLHFTHWYMPNVQKYIIRILWMVPLYAVQSWMSLRFRDARIYIDTVRDLYEAFVISSFFYYFIELLGGQESLVRTLRTKAAASDTEAGQWAQHTFPLNYVLEPWRLGMEFAIQTKHGVLQYVVVKTIATFAIFGFQSLGVYGEGEFRWSVTYPYMAFLINISVMYALYCLVMLFHVVSEDLRYPINWRPLGKFLCVKGVVFFTWWQSVVIFYLESHGIIEDVGGWTGQEVANGLIDYCICIEMVFFAIAHSYTFTHTEYLPSTVRDALQAAEDEAAAGEDSNNAPPRRSSYRPPTTLNQPMSFRDAFWSSTLPTETVQDINRLRRGVDRVISQASEPGIISLQEVNEEDGAEEESAVVSNLL